VFAAEIRRKRVDRMRAFANWRWHVDEVFVMIKDERHYLWRAVDQGLSGIFCMDDLVTATLARVG